MVDKKIYFLIFIGFIISNLLNIFYIKNYDNLEKINSDDNQRHSMVKSVNENHFLEAEKLKDHIKSGKSYFKSGGEYNRNYLPSKIIFLYSFITGHDLVEKNEDCKIDLCKKITTNNKKIILLIFQSILYYFLLIFFIVQLHKYINKSVILFITLFLSLEPTILQWHSSFWSESIFLSIQLLFSIYMIKSNKKILEYFFLGVILGLMFLQRSAAVFYIIIVFFYFLIFLKSEKFKKIFSFILGYLLVLSFLGLHVYQRSGLLYITPLDQRNAVSNYMLPSIVSKSESISFLEANSKINNHYEKWKNENNLDLNTEKDKLKYLNYVKSYSYKYLIENPLITINHMINKTFHTGVFDPFYVYYFHKYEYKGVNEYYGSKTQKSLIPIRIIYTTLIYFIILIGIIYSLRKNNFQINLFFILSYIYFLLILGWMGSPRYYTPCLIYLSFFFGNGCHQIWYLIKKKL